LKKKDPVIFKGLAHSTVEGWIDRTGKPRWTEAALRMAELGNHQGHSNGGQKGIFTNYLDVEKAIIKHLEVLHDNGAVLTVITIRAIMIAMISDLAPEIFDHRAKDGSQFQCSDTFVQCWLHNILHWS
ncbi:hypothetical protein P692DRAFT_20691496, partial [Suillus brevipes Sb2]